MLKKQSIIVIGLKLVLALSSISIVSGPALANCQSDESESAADVKNEDTASVNPEVDAQTKPKLGEAISDCGGQMPFESQMDDMDPMQTTDPKITDPAMDNPMTADPTLSASQNADSKYDGLWTLKQAREGDSGVRPFDPTITDPAGPFESDFDDDAILARGHTGRIWVCTRPH